LQDEVVNRTEQTKAEVKAYVEDCLAAYAVEEDVELEERLANLSPISAEEIDALYMDEAETTTVAQKTVNGFRAEVYNKALSDLKLVPTSRATVASVRAFLVKFVESLKPV
jgi:polyhydroxyalkanoate synthesis regulator phasin